MVRLRSSTDSANYLGGVRGLKIFRAASTTFLDQLALSIGSFFIGLVFIYKSTPEQYGIFSFFMAIYYFFASAQNALINTPLIVISPRLPESTRNSFEKGVFGVLFISIPIVVLLVLIWAGSLHILNHDGQFKITRIIVFAVFLGPVMLREFWRAEEYAKLQPTVALVRDLTYSVLTITIVTMMISLGVLSVNLVFVAMAFSALLVVAAPSMEMCRPIPRWHEIVSSFQQAWKYSCWSLLGATSSWLQGSAYVYLPFLLIGVREVAYLAGARLVMMPVSLLSGSWGNYFRPLASRKLSEGDISAAMRLFFISSLAIVTLLVFYTTFVLLLLQAAPEAWLPEDYRDIGNYVLLWAVIIFITTIRSNASSIFQASLAFKDLALRGLLSAVCTVILTTVLIFEMGAMGALVGRVFGEIILMSFLLLGLRRTLHSSTGLVV